MTKTTRNIIIAILIIFIVGIAIYFLIFYKKQDEIATIIPTPISTPLFPFSEEIFKEEVKNNCAPPPFDPEDSWPWPGEMPEDEKINMLSFFLAYKATGKENIEVVNYVTSDTDWYCFGIAVPEKFDEFLASSDWGNWFFEVTLVYWSKNGLVTYEYKPSIPTQF